MKYILGLVIFFLQGTTLASDLFTASVKVERKKNHFTYQYTVKNKSLGSIVLLEIGMLCYNPKEDAGVVESVFNLDKINKNLQPFIFNDKEFKVLGKFPSYTSAQPEYEPDDGASYISIFGKEKKTVAPAGGGYKPDGIYKFELHTKKENDDLLSVPICVLSRNHGKVNIVSVSEDSSETNFDSKKAEELCMSEHPILENGSDLSSSMQCKKAISQYKKKSIRVIQSCVAKKRYEHIKENIELSKKYKKLSKKFKKNSTDKEKGKHLAMKSKLIEKLDKRIDRKAEKLAKKLEELNKHAEKVGKKCN